MDVRRIANYHAMEQCKYKAIRSHNSILEKCNLFIVKLEIEIFE